MGPQYRVCEEFHAHVSIPTAHLCATLRSLYGKFLSSSEFFSSLLGDGVGKLRVNETVVLHVFINGVQTSDNFIVATRLSDEVIIGATTMQKWRIKLDLENEKVIIDKRMARLLLA